MIQRVQVQTQCVCCKRDEPGIFDIDVFKIPDYDEIIFPYICQVCEDILLKNGANPENLKNALADITAVVILKKRDRLN